MLDTVRYSYILYLYVPRPISIEISIKHLITNSDMVIKGYKNPI